MFENDEWKREFLERYAYHLKNTFAVEVSMPVLSELKENIKSEINNEAATFKWNPAAFEREMQVLETFLINRPAYAKKYLQETLEISEQEMKEIFGE